MKSYTAPALTVSALAHLTMALLVMLVWAQLRPVELSVQRGGIVLQVVMLPSETPSPEHWHVHAPLLPSDHQHYHADQGFTVHTHAPQARPPQPAVTSPAKPSVALVTTPPAAPEFIEAEIEVTEPLLEPLSSTAPADAQPTPAKDPAPPKAQQAATQPATPIAETPLAQNDIAGATVDVLPQSLPVNPPPVYPSAARAGRQAGRVLLSVQIDERGQVTKLSLAQSSGFRLLDQAALDAVRHWRFRPAESFGQPVVSTVQVPIRFSLNGQ